MSNVIKRSNKPSQRTRKKVPANLSKVPSTQNPSPAEDLGIFSNPHLTYHFARYFIGNVGEVYANSTKCVGVIKAVSPDGIFGLECVRSSPCKGEDELFELEMFKRLHVSDIKKIILRNVNPLEVQKEETLINDTFPSLDDPRTCLQHYFHPNENAECISLASDDNFPPEDMFAINEQKYKVVSSYKDNLEGYTVQLDKSDPNYQAKAEYFAKVAQEIDDASCGKSAWDEATDEYGENEELMFSAVLQDGVTGREFKYPHPNNVKEKNRKINHKNLPDLSTNSLISNDKFKEVVDSPTVKAQLTSPETNSQNISDLGQMSNELATTTKKSPNVSALLKLDSPQKAENKRFTLDPDAPEFKPSGALSVDPNAPSHPLPRASFPFSPLAGPCTSFQMPSFTVVGQHPLYNNSSSGVSLCLPSSIPYTLSSVLSPHLSVLPPQGGFSPQQLAAMAQFPIPGSPSIQPTGSQSINSNKGPRQGIPLGMYTRPRSIDQLNLGAQHIPLPLFPSQGYPFSPSAPCPIGVPFVPAVSGVFQPCAYPAMHALTNSVTAPQATVQQPSGSPHSTQSVQVNQTPSNLQSLNSASQAHGPQFHLGYNPNLFGIEGQSAAMAYYPPGHPGTFALYSRAPGLIQFPVQHVGSGGQPSQIGSQVHQQNQLPLVQPPSLQLQPTHQGSVQTVQQQQMQPSFVFNQSPYIPPQQLFSHAMVLPPQGVHNAFALPHNVHTRPTGIPNQTNGAN